MRKMPTLGRGELAERTIVPHLGNVASVAALLNGVCVNPSMGMIPTGGLVMSTRSGDLGRGGSHDRRDSLFSKRNAHYYRVAQQQRVTVSRPI